MKPMVIEHSKVEMVPVSPSTEEGAVQKSAGLSS
jgi:hypothetical protein